MILLKKLLRPFKKEIYFCLGKVREMSVTTRRSFINARIRSMPNPPVISIIMPTYETPREWLVDAIESVRAQLYPHWELCVADDASKSPHIREVLEEYVKQDARIKYVIRTENGHISAASNSALSLAKGEYIALLDHDDTLTRDALYHLAQAIKKNPKCDMFYSDEDKLTEDGKTGEIYFKPDWDLDLFFGHNFFNHLGCFRREKVKQLEGFRLGYEGSQDYDLTLRMLKLSQQEPYHIPRVLYHWRMVKGSAAQEMEAKPYAHSAARLAIQEYLDNRYPGAKITAHPMPAFHRVIWPLPEKLPLATLIVDAETLSPDLAKNIETHTRYPHEIMTTKPGMSFAARMNEAVSRAKGAVVGILHPHIEILPSKTERCWLGEMVALTLRTDVGAVSAKILHPDSTLKTAGLFVSGWTLTPQQRVLEGIRGEEDFGYYGRARTTHQSTLLPAECFFMRKEVFEKTEGFSSDFPENYPHIDLAFRLQKDNYRCVVNTFVHMKHKGKLRGENFSLAERVRLMRWGKKLFREKYYNPNLRRWPMDYTISPRAFF